MNVFSSYLDMKCFFWRNCVGICTGDDFSVVGSNTGFASLVRVKEYIILALSQSSVYSLKCDGYKMKRNGKRLHDFTIMVTL
jgi:hypothetical protein